MYQRNYYNPSLRRYGNKYMRLANKLLNIDLKDYATKWLLTIPGGLKSSLLPEDSGVKMEIGSAGLLSL